MIGACLTTTATKWNANAAHPIAVAFLPAKIGSGPNCKHAITIISLRSLPIRLRHALTENSSLAVRPREKQTIWATVLENSPTRLSRFVIDFPQTNAPKKCIAVITSLHSVRQFLHFFHVAATE